MHSVLAAILFGATYNAEYVSNYDADTWTLRIEVPLVATVLAPEWVSEVEIDVVATAKVRESVRLNMIDTPEIRGRCPEEKALAKKAKYAVEEILENAEQITVTFDEREKFGRILTGAIVDGEDIPQWLVENGYAVEYHGGKRISWCE